MGRGAGHPRLRHAGRNHGGAGANVREAIEACLSVDVDQPESTDKDKALE